MNYTRRFLKEYDDDIKAFEDLTSEQDRLNFDIFSSGAYGLYRILRKNLVRLNWKDSKKFPIKKHYYDNKLLVCCISLRKLASSTNFSLQKTQKLLNLLESANWIEIAHEHTYRNQTVCVLGHWEISSLTGYAEKLFYHDSLRSDNRRTIIEDLEDLYKDDFRFQRVKNTHEHGSNNFNTLSKAL